MRVIKIEELENNLLDNFSSYLSKHISENGKEGLLFQPLSIKQSVFDSGLVDKFRIGVNKNFNDTGWRKVWVARNEEGKVVGHIDIRPYKELNTQHRVLLGMGVDGSYRKLKIGHRLLEFVIEYCKSQPKIAWLDLQVLANNLSAIHLYKKMEFEELYTTTDMFRIENISYDYTSMTLNVKPDE